MKIKYDINLMKYISLFENISHAKVKDCFVDNNSQLFFVVQEGEIGKAIGKGASNIKKTESLLKRKIRIVEFSQDIIKFITNLVYPIKLIEIANEEGIIKITKLDTKTKGLLIGRNAQTIQNYTNIVKRYFKITELKVI